MLQTTFSLRGKVLRRDIIQKLDSPVNDGSDNEQRKQTALVLL